MCEMIQLIPQVRRLIEEENQKRRKALRRHYNETVRELAAFVRKRDKRVLAHNVRSAELSLGGTSRHSWLHVEYAP